MFLKRILRFYCLVVRGVYPPYTLSGPTTEKKNFMCVFPYKKLPNNLLIICYIYIVDKVASCMQIQRFKFVWEPFPHFECEKGQECGIGMDCPVLVEPVSMFLEYSNVQFLVFPLGKLQIWTSQLQFINQNLKLVLEQLTLVY